MLSADLLLLLWIAVPFLASYLQSKVSTPVMIIRNLIIVVPPIYLILASTLQRIQWPAVRHAWSAVLLAGLLYFLIGQYGYYDTIKKQQFREAAQFVVENEDGRPVVAFTWGRRYFDYYFEALGSENRVGILGGLPEDIAKVDAFLARQTPGEFWFMVGHREPEREFVEHLDRSYELLDTREFVGTSVRKYQLP